MKNVKWIIGIGVIALLVVIAVVLNSYSISYPNKTFKIGVFQVVRHPVLDAMAESFQSGLSKNLAGHVQFETMVPEGDAVKTEQMAQKFATEGYDLVFVIGTNPAQSLEKKNKTMPIVLGAVTDPAAAGLVSSWEHPGTNVTGTSDLSPVGAQLDRLSQILPKANRVGIIFNPAEDNSNIIVAKFKTECEKRNLTVVTATISNQNEIKQTLVSLVGKIDVLYAPTDATVQSAFPLLIKTANELKLPVFSCDEGTAKAGAIFSVGFDYNVLGQISAEMATQILKGKKSPADMPIRMADEFQLFYNSIQIKNLGLSLPASWAQAGKQVSS